MTGRLIPRTAVVSGAIVALAMAADWVMNVWLMPGHTPYTPIGTLIIAGAISPVAVFVLLLQNERVTRALLEVQRAHQAQAAAEAAAEARTRFLANTSHELRTPLNGIVGYTELMMEAAEVEGRSQDLADHSRVIDAATRLLALINDVLDLAKGESGTLSVRNARYDVRKVLTDAVDLVRHAMAANGNTVTLDVDDTLTEGVSDASRLSQCVLNLLSNAAKFTSGGAVTLKATRETQSGEDWLVVAVADNGVGIPADRLASVFEPFMQVEALETRSHRGAGLGLAITRQIAELLGGAIDATSEPGRGSCFTLRVPLFARPVLALAA
jgi:signal transduction histidine kinase